VGAAEDSGSGDLLYPVGVNSVEDVPHDLHVAILHAHKILSWYKNLVPEEIPPRWMWSFDERLVSWFEEVKRQRDSKFNGNSPSVADRGNESTWGQNEFARGLRD
jgi:hypothetical protein